MDYEVKMRIALTIGFILIILGYIRSFTKYKSRKEKFIDKAKERGDFTRARYVKHIKRGKSYEASDSKYVRNYLYIVKYEYEVNGKKYYKTLAYQEPGALSIQYPLEITIYYDKRNPKKGYCVEEIDEGTKKSFGCFSSIAFAFFIMWLILNLF